MADADALNAALLSLADEMDAEAAWRGSEAHFARRDGRAADAYKLDAERRAYEALADLLRGRMTPPMHRQNRPERRFLP